MTPAAIVMCLGAYMYMLGGWMHYDGMMGSYKMAGLCEDPLELMNSRRSAFIQGVFWPLLPLIGLMFTLIDFFTSGTDREED